jgi:hypothetical protein
MKKSLYIFLFSILPLVSFGQIKRNFDGIVLGKTTKQGVVNYFSNKGIPYTFTNIGTYDAVSSKEGRPFGGVLWQFNDYVLFNNVVFQITYTKMSGQGLTITKEEIDLEFERLFISLKHKYGSYFKSSKSNKDTKEFSDSSVKISLRRGNYQDHYMFSIEYTDIKIMEKSFMSHDDEL